MPSSPPRKPGQGSKARKRYLFFFAFTLNARVQTWTCQVQSEHARTRPLNAYTSGSLQAGRLPPTQAHQKGRLGGTRCSGGSESANSALVSFRVLARSA
ncbi:hypothetical protein DUNSADRAFT_2266 [Dunaliella salina]|uniref:Encoded protein n=1 Tax=Dunaliella salina TaxID=3046 RepID=A0ABQ7FWS5_DUNSA|nr:hypothetical protein DUNSADRAFT_2266 [Dunaliella salina]|eukprot:KAF5826722.1 hypothetical protein DUNSADRAFT_2266 [Dunaliella salina]